jgi:hypothetical protein
MTLRPTAGAARLLVADHIRVEPAGGGVVVFAASCFSSTDVSMSCVQLTIMIARC